MRVAARSFPSINVLVIPSSVKLNLHLESEPKTGEFMFFTKFPEQLKKDPICSTI